MQASGFNQLICDCQDLIEAQLAVWPLAATNFFQLREIKRKRVPLGSLDSAVQCNPARIVSTGAKTDAQSIKERKCFLCSHNRPEEQFAMELLKGWDLLINPYPILPVHFTIVDKEHRDQAEIPFELVEMAEKLPGLTVFYKGARAGASAPDHRHAQAVIATELPLLRLVEQLHPIEKSGFASGFSLAGADLPFDFISAVITPDSEGLEMLKKIHSAFGIDAETGSKDPGLVNAFFWLDPSGILRTVVIPRKAHRPRCYDNPTNQQAGEEPFIVSPGAIDMAGLMIAPRPNDYERIDEAKMREIYSDVAFSEGLPGEIKRHFRL